MNLGVDSLAVSGFFAIFVYSFFSSAHCSLMCGPLVCSSLGPKSHFRHLDLWIYNLSRVLSYTAIGWFAGVAGAAFNEHTGFGKAAALIIGLFLVAFGIGNLVNRNPLKNRLLKPPNLLGRLTSFFSGRLQIKANFLNTGYFRSATLGLITVFLPCMTLAPAFITSAGTGNGIAGASVMAAFALGTVPVMILAPDILGRLITRKGKMQSNIIASIFLIISGGITLLRAFG